jgi:NADPH:quinone reductase-like Zn-dependent oxidoreductase
MCAGLRKAISSWGKVTSLAGIAGIVSPAVATFARIHWGVGVNRPGAWAEFVSIPASNAWHADPSISLDVLSCFDPLGNAVHTALTFDLVGEDVLITGAGPIGCMAIPICRHAGARHIVVTDVNPYRLDLARKMGATLALDVRTEKLADAMTQLGMKEGFDVCLEMSGNPKAFADIIPNMFYGGKIALLGIMPSTASIDWNVVVFHSPDAARNLRTRNVRDLVQNDLPDPERCGYFTGHHPSLSISTIQGSHRARQVRQLWKDRNGVERALNFVRRFCDEGGFRTNRLVGQPV